MINFNRTVYNLLEDLVYGSLADFLTVKTVKFAKYLQRNDVMDFISKHPEEIDSTVTDYIMCLFSYYIGQAYIRISKSGIKCMTKMIGNLFVGKSMASSVEDISETELRKGSQFISFHLHELIMGLYKNGIIPHEQVSDLLKTYIKPNHTNYALMQITLSELYGAQSIYRIFNTISKDTLNEIFYHKYKGYKYMEKPFKGECYRYLMFNIDTYTFSV